MKKPAPIPVDESPKPAAPHKKRGPEKMSLNRGMLTILAQKGLTQADCAAILGCSTDTIQRNYRNVYALGLQKCCASLRRKQVALALAGNVTMLVWLGKNMLGQSDKQEITGAAGAPLIPDVDREEIIGKLLGTGATKAAARLQ